MKKCSECGEIKELMAFRKYKLDKDGYLARCNNCLENISHDRVKQKIQRRKKRRRFRYNDANDEYKISMVLRKRLLNAIEDNQKHTSAVRDLGCSIDFLLVRLRTLLGREPTKDDHIDHIIPFQYLDMTYYSHQRLVCHYKNLRYMNKTDNKKRDYTDIIEFPELIGMLMECS